MIPEKIHHHLCILFTIIVFLSCQKKNTETTKPQVEKLILIADRFYNNKNFDSAFYYYNKATFVCNPITDTENYISTLNDIAGIQQNHADYVESESTLKEAIPFFKYIKNPAYKWTTYVTLSINYLNTYDYKNAILYNKKALLPEVKPWQKLAAENNIAVILMEQEKYDQSLQIFLPISTKKKS
ncbi:hypothetical protein [Flavobacterium sp.]|uniref:hypothetical protein n=1 Tax=Flavobacterium sp. TaxID=239 RepID=UPI003D127361